MKFMLESLCELGYSQLIAVNGGCSGSCCGYTPTVSGGNGNSIGTPPSGPTVVVGGCSGNCSKDGLLNIQQAVDDSMDKKDNKYIFGVNDCDIWLQNVLKKAGINLSSLWGDAYTNSVEDHEKQLSDKTTVDSNKGWNVVLMTDSDKFSINHCGIINVNSDGSVSFYQNTKSAGGPTIENYSSVKEFENAYAYKDFDYYKLSN